MSEKATQKTRSSLAEARYSQVFRYSWEISGVSMVGDAECDGEGRGGGGGGGAPAVKIFPSPSPFP
jgi:hypothetical protein